MSEKMRYNDALSEIVKTFGSTDLGNRLYDEVMKFWESKGKTSVDWIE